MSAPPNNETAVMSQEDLMMAMVTNMASITSRTSMSVVVVGGVVSCKNFELGVNFLYYLGISDHTSIISPLWFLLFWLLFESLKLISGFLTKPALQ